MLEQTTLEITRFHEYKRTAAVKSVKLKLVSDNISIHYTDIKKKNKLTSTICGASSCDRTSVVSAATGELTITGELETTAQKFPNV